MPLSLVLVVVVASTLVAGGVAPPHRIAASSAGIGRGREHDDGSSSRARITAEIGHRRLTAVGGNNNNDPAPLHLRHDTPPATKKAVSSYTTSKFTHLMTSNCRPTKNGFFGSTSGQPAIVRYGYSLESTAFADVDKILDVIDEHVMDEVLATTFSNICSTGRNLQLTSFRSRKARLGQVTGFKFEEETLEEQATCVPEVHPKNQCSYYTSQVKVFGYNMDSALVEETLSVIRDALPASITLASKFGAVRMVLAEDISRVVSIPPPSSSNSPGSVHPGAVAGLIISFFILAASVAVLLFFYRRDKKANLRKERSRKCSKKLPPMHGHGSTWKHDRQFRRNYLRSGYSHKGSLANTIPESEDSESVDMECWRREAMQRLSDYRRSQAAAASARVPETEPASERDIYMKEAMERFSEYQRSQQQTRSSSDQGRSSRDNRRKEHGQRSQQHRRRDRNRNRQRLQSDHDNVVESCADQRPPVVLEFGRSFDPERDRFIVDMEEESSAPPSYMFDPNAPPDFLFVYDQYERYDPYAADQQRQILQFEHQQQQQYDARDRVRKEQEHQDSQDDDNECEFAIREIQIV